jgi:twitching motility protein PilT
MTIYNHEFERLLRLSVEMGASDMHITVGSPPVFRIDGELKVLDGETVNAETAERYARSIMNEQQYQIFKEQGEIDFSIGIHGFSRFRINAYHQRGSISIASRIIPTRIPSLEELQLPAILKELTYKPQGLILVTGPTGSGK